MFSVYTQKAQVSAGRIRLAYVPACNAVECAKASLMPVCTCFSDNVCGGILACLRFTCFTEHVLSWHLHVVCSTQTGHLVFTLAKMMAACEVESQGSKGQRIYGGGAFRLSGGGVLSCTFNFTLMVLYK